MIEETGIIEDQDRVVEREDIVIVMVVVIDDDTDDDEVAQAVITEGWRLLQQQHTHTHTHTHDIHLLTGERKLGDGFLDTSTASLEIPARH